MISTKITADLAALDQAILAIKPGKVSAAQLSAIKAAVTTLEADLSVESAATAAEKAACAAAVTAAQAEIVRLLAVIAAVQTERDLSAKAVADAQAEIVRLSAILAAAQAECAKAAEAAKLEIARLQAIIDAEVPPPVPMPTITNFTATPVVVGGGVVTTTETQQLACPVGQVGAISQQRTVTTTDGVASYSPWTETSNTCRAPTPTTGLLKFVRSYEGYGPDLGGAPPGTACWAGKHVQGCVVDGLLLLYGGDGDWRTAQSNPPFEQRQSGQSVLSYDFSDPAFSKFEQLTPPSGNLTDGTAPASHDGSTWGYNTQDKCVYGIPGFQRGPTSSGEENIHDIKKMSVVHKYNTLTRQWIEGPSTIGNWPGEHWGGCYDSKRNRIWNQFNGMLYWYDCVPQTFGMAGHKESPDIVYYSGRTLASQGWCQRYNPVTDELICYDGYRGHVMALKLSVPVHEIVPRIVANVPALLAHEGESQFAVETGFCISIARQKAFISYSAQSFYIEGEVGGIWVVDLATGVAEHAADYPANVQITDGVESGIENGMYTACEYIDHPSVDALILWDHINGEKFIKEFLRYEFKE